MEKKYFYVISVLVLLTAGCSSVIPMPEAIMTVDDVSKAKYRIVKSNLIATSYGFNLLGMIPLKIPRYNKAMAKIYAQAGDLEGKTVLFANATLEKSAIWYIVLSVRTLTIRTDIVELLDASAEGND